MEDKSYLDKQSSKESDKEIESEKDSITSQEESPVFRKSKRKRGKKPESNKDESSPAYLAKKEFERALQMIAPSKRRKADLDYEIELDKNASELLEKMKDAAEQDSISRESSKPAIKKIELLPLVLSNMFRKDNQEILLDNGFLYSVKLWLEPYSDGSLPLLDIRTKLLEALDMMPVEKHHLKESGLGRVVMYLYKCPQETKENKKLAYRLIDKWSRPIIGQTTDYRHLAQQLNKNTQSSDVSRSKSPVSFTLPLEHVDPIQARYKKIASISRKKQR